MSDALATRAFFTPSLQDTKFNLIICSRQGRVLDRIRLSDSFDTESEFLSLLLPAQLAPMGAFAHDASLPFRDALSAEKNVLAPSPTTSKARHQKFGLGRLNQCFPRLAKHTHMTMSTFHDWHSPRANQWSTHNSNKGRQEAAPVRPRATPSPHWQQHLVSIPCKCATRTRKSIPTIPAREIQVKVVTRATRESQSRVRREVKGSVDLACKGCWQKPREPPPWPTM